MQTFPGRPALFQQQRPARLHVQATYAGWNSFSSTCASLSPVWVIST
jgi:hypothetical protein